jgi:hypothetical protein
VPAAGSGARRGTRAVVDELDPVERDECFRGQALHHEPRHDELGVRATVEDLEQVADVVVVVVGQVDPPHVVRLDD